MPQALTPASATVLRAKAASAHSTNQNARCRKHARAARARCRRTSVRNGPVLNAQPRMRQYGNAPQQWRTCHGGGEDREPRARSSNEL